MSKVLGADSIVHPLTADVFADGRAIKGEISPFVSYKGTGMNSFGLGIGDSQTGELFYHPKLRGGRDSAGLGFNGHYVLTFQDGQIVQRAWDIGRDKVMNADKPPLATYEPMAFDIVPLEMVLLLMRTHTENPRCRRFFEDPHLRDYMHPCRGAGSQEMTPFRSVLVIMGLSGVRLLCGKCVDSGNLYEQETILLDGRKVMPHFGVRVMRDRHRYKGD